MKFVLRGTKDGLESIQARKVRQAKELRINITSFFNIFYGLTF